MAWITKIIASEQVDYRLEEHAGCFVRADRAASEHPGPDAPLDYRMRSERDGALLWMGGGLEDFGLRAGTAMDDAGKQAARMLMNGVHPLTGARLVPAEVRTHEKAQLTGARLMEAISAAAAEHGVEPHALLDGKPKQQRQLGVLTRMVHKSGEVYRLHIDTLDRLARATRIDLADVYSATELAEARAHKSVRVNVRVRGWDLVADLPKSVSAIQALMSDTEERELRALVHQAKDEAFAQLEQWIGYGVTSQNGAPARIATGGLIAWSVEHQSARPVDDTPGDPHLHLHLVIANLARCEDGQWRSIANSGRDLHRHAKAFDALFKARVRALTYARFGMRYEQDDSTGAWEVMGVPAELRDLYSRRSAEVNAKAGPDASRTDKLRVSQETRHAKHDTGTLDLRRSWRERAESIGIDVAAVLTAAAPGPLGPAGIEGIDGPGGGPRTPSPDELAATVFHPETGLTSSDKEFSHAQLLAAVAHALPYGIAPGVGRLEALTGQALALKGHAVPLPRRGSTVMSNTERRTTADILRAEQIIVDQARTRFADGSAQLTTEQTAAAIDIFEVAAGYALSDQQHAVVNRLLTAGHGVDAVIGVAGAGKTTLMDACRIGWDTAGLTHAGAALSAVAAQNLQSEAGIPSRTIASWRRRIREGVGLTGIDVLVIDEAAMTDDRAVALLLNEAARTNTKVVAIGDPLQLQAVGPGGGFAEVHRLVNGETLTENRRQKDPAERAALQTWRAGGRREALQMLAECGRVHATDSADDARNDILATWAEVRTRWPNVHDLLAHLVVLAPRNSDVDQLNSHAQAIRRAAGELGTEHTYALPGGHSLTLAVGDLVRVRANDYRSRRNAGPDVLNGYRATVTAIDSQHRVQITWRTTTADGTHTYPSAWLDMNQIVNGSLSLGYAMTVAASQGMTADTALIYGHGANAFGLYAGITRGKEANHLWLPAAALEDDETRNRLGEPRTERELLDRAVTAYAKLLHQDRPDAMISDQLRPAPAPVLPPLQPDVPHWSQRPYGQLPSALLATRISNAVTEEQRLRLLAAECVRSADASAAKLAAEPTPGQSAAASCAATLETAEQLAGSAREHTTRAAEGAGERKRAQSALEEFEASRGNRLMLRLTGSSRRARREVSTTLLASAIAEEQRARQAAADSVRQAWQTFQHSPYAEAMLGYDPSTPPRNADDLVGRLSVMRAQLPQVEGAINRRIAEDVGYLRGQAETHTLHADAQRTAIAGLRAEQVLRARIDKNSPHQYAVEVEERTNARQRASVAARATTPAVQAGQSLPEPPAGPVRSRQGVSPEQAGVKAIAPPVDSAALGPKGSRY